MCIVYLKNWKNIKWRTTHYQELKKLETGLVKQVIAVYLSFSQKLSVDMADTNNRANDFLLRNYFIIIYCWCKTCRIIKRMPIHTVYNIVKYVPTEVQEPIPAANSTLQANET